MTGDNRNEPAARPATLETAPGRQAAAADAHQYVVRFSLRQRVEHIAVILLFAALALTGFPQKFYASPWASGVTQALGGLPTVRFVHRSAGLLLAAFTLLHFTFVLRDLLLKGTPPSMIPTRQDFRDAVHQLRYYLRLRDTPARFDRFDYREKFEYWGLVFGNLIMISTGVVLLLPMLAARLLGGELIPAAKIAHSNEGLMAFLVIVTWHIYNAHFAPGVFPYNPTIFTGRISKHHLKRDHPLEYERLFPAEADAEEAKSPPADA